MQEKRPTTENIIEALKVSDGAVDSAAKTLGCSSEMVYKEIEQDPRVRRTYKKAQEDFLDLAESNLRKFVTNKDERYDPRLQLDAIKFYLRTQGKQREYTFKEEHASREPQATNKQTATVNNPSYSYGY